MHLLGRCVYYAEYGILSKALLPRRGYDPIFWIHVSQTREGFNSDRIDEVPTPICLADMNPKTGFWKISHHYTPSDVLVGDQFTG